MAGRNACPTRVHDRRIFATSRPDGEDAPLLSRRGAARRRRPSTTRPAIATTTPRWSNWPARSPSSRASISRWPRSASSRRRRTRRRPDGGSRAAAASDRRADSPPEAGPPVARRVFECSARRERLMTDATFQCEEKTAARDEDRRRADARAVQRVRPGLQQDRQGFLEPDLRPGAAALLRHGLPGDRQLRNLHARQEAANRRTASKSATCPPAAASRCCTKARTNSSAARMKRPWPTSRKRATSSPSPAARSISKAPA